MDRLSTSKLNAYDLAIFMRNNGHNIYSSDVKDVIQAHDLDKDGNLVLDEFSSLILTHTDEVLRKRTRERFQEYVGPKDRLS